MPNVPNASFYYFKPYGKYYCEGRGFLTPAVFRDIRTSFRERVMAANKKKWPGMSGDCEWCRIVIIPDSEVDFGWPLCLEPTTTEF